MSSVNPIVNQDPNSHHPNKKSLRKKLVIFGSGILGFIALLMLWALASKAPTTSNSSDAETEQTAADKRSTEGGVPELIAVNLNKTTEIKPKSEDITVTPPLVVPHVVPPPPPLTLDMQRSMAYQQQMLDYRQQQLLSAMASDTVVQLKSGHISATATDDALSQLNAQAQMLQ